jgi:hypothetical protein
MRIILKQSNLNTDTGKIAIKISVISDHGIIEICIFYVRMRLYQTVLYGTIYNVTTVS